MVKIKYIGLTNLILNKNSLPELIQGRASAENITNTLLSWLKNPSQLAKVYEDFALLRQKTGPAEAVKKCAASIKVFVES